MAQPVCCKNSRFFGVRKFKWKTEDTESNNDKGIKLQNFLQVAQPVCRIISRFFGKKIQTDRKWKVQGHSGIIEEKNRILNMRVQSIPNI